MGGTKMRKIIIIGASGHGKVIADIAILNGYENIVFLDDNENIKECAGFPVVGQTNAAVHMDGDKIVAIGNAKMREKIQKDIVGAVTLIHPKAVIGRGVILGEGTVVMPGAIINTGVSIGKGCIVNTGATVDHDSKIGDFVHIAVGAHLAGSVRIGNRSWIGAGSIVINNLSICEDCMIGAGAVVVKDIMESGTYVGVPAKRR